MEQHISEIWHEASPESVEQAPRQKLPYEFHIPGTVHTQALQNHSHHTRSVEAVFGIHTMCYQHRMITRRDKSVIQKGLSKGKLYTEVTSAASRNTLWRCPDYYPISQQRQICYYWWSLHAIYVKGWQQVECCHFTVPGSIHPIIIIQRGQVWAIKWTGIMEIPSVLSALIQRPLCCDWHAWDWQREWLDKMCCLVEC